MGAPTLKELPAPPAGRTGWPWTTANGEESGPLSPRENLPRVSIVTPSYNQGEYLEETIRSVLLQGYPNLEYIVMDGGSSDNTREILKKYEPWITYCVSKPDKGQSDALNQGFQVATGQILAWVNSDDTYLPGAILTAVHCFATTDADLVYGDAYNIDGLSHIIESWKTEPFDQQRLSEGCIICQPAAFFRAQVFATVGPFDTSLHYTMDYDYWVRVAKQHCRIQYLKKHLGNNRWQMNAKQISKRVAARNEILFVVRKHYGYVPLSWIYGFSYIYATEALVPNIQGVLPDSYAGQRVSIYLRNKSKYDVLLVEGEVMDRACPLSLKILINGRILDEVSLARGKFSLSRSIGPDAGKGGVEINLIGDKGFAPDLRDLPGSNKLVSHRMRQPRSYLVRKIAMTDGRGGEHVMYIRWKAWLLLLWFPALCLWKSLRINRSIPMAELSKSGRVLWNYLVRSLCSVR